TGADAGGGPRVRVFDGRTGAPLTGPVGNGFFAYDSAFLGGVRVATGDFNGDGTPDIVTSPGAGGGPHVRVFNGQTGTPLSGAIGAGFMAFAGSFTGGVYVAVGDVNGDGTPDIIAGAGAGAGPGVRAFDGKNSANVLQDFLAYAANFSGGVRVAAADVDGDGR